MTRNTSPEFLAYKKAADKVRKGDDSPEAHALAQAARVAYEATLPPPAPQAPGWWNTPAAASCWTADAQEHS
jgi:hypothetical protein